MQRSFQHPFNHFTPHHRIASSSRRSLWTCSLSQSSVLSILWESVLGRCALTIRSAGQEIMNSYKGCFYQHHHHYKPMYQRMRRSSLMKWGFTFQMFRNIRNAHARQSGFPLRLLEFLYYSSYQGVSCQCAIEKKRKPSHSNEFHLFKRGLLLILFFFCSFSLFMNHEEVQRIYSLSPYLVSHTNPGSLQLPCLLHHYSVLVLFLLSTL